MHALELSIATNSRDVVRLLAAKHDTADSTCSYIHDAAIEPSVRLRRSIYQNDLVLVRRIVKNNPRCIRSPDLTDRCNTSLHLAASLGLIEIAMFLVEAGHEDEGISRNSDRETPLMAAVRCKDGDDMVRLLAARFPRCISWENKEGFDAFQLAAKIGADKVLAILLSLSPNKPELLSHTSPDGNAALHYASAYGNMKAINILAASGADPYCRNEGGYTAIDYSSTVQAEVYFRGLVLEMEKKKAADSEKMGRRRGGSGPGSVTGMLPGGVRLVDERADAVARARSPSLKGIVAAQPSSGRATPSGWREGWPKLRSRAGSTD